MRRVPRAQHAQPSADGCSTPAATETCWRMETPLEFTPSIRQTLLSHRGKLPELTRSHTTSQPMLSVSGSQWGEGEQRPPAVGHSPTRDGLGVRPQRCRFCRLWIQAITSRAGKTVQHQNRPVIHRKIQHLQQPIPFGLEQDIKR